MAPPANKRQAGHADQAYALARLTRPLPSLPGLQALVACARLGSISAAAAHLHRTQGAISRQIQHLEEHYGRALFARSASGLTLTAPGRELLDVAEQLLGALAGYGERQSGAARTLTLRLPSTFALRWLLPRLQQIRQALGDVDLRLSTSASDQPDFGAADVDAIIVRGSGHWPGIEALELFAETLTPLCAPALAAGIACEADLARATLLHTGPEHAEWRGWLAAAGVAQAGERHGMVFDTLELCMTAAQQGHGIAIGDPRLARDRLDAGTLLAPFAFEWQNGLSYFLVFPSRRADQPDIRALARIVRELA